MTYPGPVTSRSELAYSLRGRCDGFSFLTAGVPDDWAGAQQAVLQLEVLMDGRTVATWTGVSLQHPVTLNAPISLSGGNTLTLVARTTAPAPGKASWGNAMIHCYPLA